MLHSPRESVSAGNRIAPRDTSKRDKNIFLHRKPQFQRVDTNSTLSSINKNYFRYFVIGKLPRRRLQTGPVPPKRLQFDPGKISANSLEPNFLEHFYSTNLIAESSRDTRHFLRKIADIRELKRFQCDRAARTPRPNSPLIKRAPKCSWTLENHKRKRDIQSILVAFYYFTVESYQ